MSKGLPGLALKLAGSEIFEEQREKAAGVISRMAEKNQPARELLSQAEELAAREDLPFLLELLYLTCRDGLLFLLCRNEALLVNPVEAGRWTGAVLLRPGRGDAADPENSTAGEYNQCKPTPRYRGDAASITEEVSLMPRVIGVRFRPAGKIYHFDPGRNRIEPGMSVIVETARGLEMGLVVSGEEELPESELVMPLKRVLRPARSADMRQIKKTGRRRRRLSPLRREIDAMA